MWSPVVIGSIYHRLQNTVAFFITIPRDQREESLFCCTQTDRTSRQDPSTLQYAWNILPKRPLRASHCGSSTLNPIYRESTSLECGEHQLLHLSQLWDPTTKKSHLLYIYVISIANIIVASCTDSYSTNRCFYIYFYIFYILTLRCKYKIKILNL